MAIEEGRSFDGVVLERTADSRGATKNLTYRPGDDEVVRILLGGIVAVRLCRTRWYPALFDSAFDDIGYAADFFREGETDERMIRWNVEATAERVERRWSGIEAVAAALMESRRLSFESVRRLVRENTQKGALPFRSATVDWTPLVQNLSWRIKYPRGMQDALDALMAEARKQQNA